MLSDIWIIVIPSVSVLIPVVNSLPPPWVPSEVCENLNGWAEGWTKVYVTSLIKSKVGLCIPLIT